VSLIANVCFLIGCISPALARDVTSVYRMNVTFLAEGLQKQAFGDARNVTNLLHPVLPTYWHWGMSGICDTYYNNNATRCRRAFPPTQNILTIVEETLRDHLDGDQEQVISGIVSSWNETLSNLDPSVLRDKESQYGGVAKASVALAIIAIIHDCFIPVVYLVTSTGGRIASVGSSLLSIAAGTLAVQFMHDGVHGAVDTGENAGGSVIFLFIAAALRILFSGGDHYLDSTRNWHEESRQWNDEARWRQQELREQHEEYLRTARQQADWWQQARPVAQPDVQRPAPAPAPVPTNTVPATPAGIELLSKKEIGYLGEHHIYNWFADHAIPDWSYDQWTSKLRSFKQKFPAFNKPEKLYADFTYYDRSGRMRDALQAEGVLLPATNENNWRNGTTFHIEVKTTLADWDNIFFVSGNQVGLMQKYERESNHSYILARVYQARGRQIGIKWYLNPWSHHDLIFDGPDEKGDYTVTVIA
ncbi:hypothetical protein QBC35DRAFT_393751, partial [Podospora australis]